MPINPNILLQGRVADIGGALSRGIQAGGMLQQLQEQRALAPLRKRMLDTQVQQAEAAINDAERNRQLESVYTGYTELNELVQSGDFDAAAERGLGRLSQLRARGQTNTSDTQIGLQLIDAMSKGGEAGELAKRRWDAYGKGLNQAMRVRGLAVADSGVDERFSPTTTTLNDGTTIQTTSTGRKVVTDIQGNVLTGRQAADAIRKASEFGTEEQRERALARTRAKEQEGVRQQFVKQGLDARGMIKDTEQMIKLNKLISTGKTARAKKMFTDVFGVTDPNLNEFNARAGQLVLSQIRMLGANPTEGERSFLTEIGPSIDQGGEVNEALLNDLLEVQRRQVERGKWFSRNPNKTIEDYLIEFDEFAPSKRVAPVGNLETLSDDDLLRF